LTARINRHRLRQRQRKRQRERERAQALKRVLGAGSGDSTWVKLQAKVSKGVGEIGKAAKRKAAKSTPKRRQRLAASTGRSTGKAANPMAKAKTRTGKAARTKSKACSKGHRPAGRATPSLQAPGGIAGGIFTLLQHLWPRSWWARSLAGLAVFVAIIGGTITLGIYVRYKRTAESYDLRQVGRMPQESVVFDTYGTPFTRLHGDGRVIVELENISPFFIDALVAREDTRFYEHSGVDLFGVARAVVRNAREGGFAQGASTLTMQLARISFDMREKTLHRKLVEALLARRIEQQYTKEQIIFLYANRVFLGSGLYGIEAAARAHFGKPASDLSLGESAMLAGVIRAPNRFSPFRHYDAALSERDTVLNRMLELDMISAEQAQTAKKEKIPVLSQDEISPSDLRPMGVTEIDRKHRNESYISEAVRREIEHLLTDDQQQVGGLDIYTTFDLELQQAAEQAVENRLHSIENTPDYPHPVRAAHRGDRTDYLQAAVTVVDNGLGAVRAMVGGRSFEESHYNRATQAHRQAGSIFKPLIYAIAFESGLFPGTLISDQPIQPGEIPWDTTGWNPRNSDGTYGGWTRAEEGLIRSRNTMTVRVGETAGIKAVSEMARYAGIADGNTEGTFSSPQIYIGNLGASLMSLTSAYSAFANEGFRADPYFIERIQDRLGNVLYQREPEGYRVVSPGATWLTSQVLQKVMEPGGTGQSVIDLGVNFPVAGKTGTTNDYHDAWFVGYSSSLSCGVWVGLDQPERIVDRGYGGRIALPIWADIMRASETLRYPTMPLPVADDVMTIELCQASGLLASSECRAHGDAYQERAPHAMIPRQTCDHRGTNSQPGHIHGPSRANERPLSDDEKQGLFGRLKSLFSAS